MLLDEKLEELKNQGWQRLGRGRCSVVYGTTDRVIKFVDTRDEGQLLYLDSEKIRNVLGPYHPRYNPLDLDFIGLDLKYRDEYTKFRAYAGKRFSKIPKTFCGVTSKYFMSLVRSYIYDSRYSAKLEDSFCLCLDFLSKVAHSNDYTLDIFKKNLMLNDGQIIINDPFFTP